MPFVFGKQFRDSFHPFLLSSHPSPVFPFFLDLPAALHPSTLLLVLLFVDSLISTMQILYFLFVLQLFYFLSLENQYNTANELLLYFITTKREKQ